ncbi:MAG: metal ABC transporter substrate-binding protein [Clostridia bacterium]
MAVATLVQKRGTKMTEFENEETRTTMRNQPVLKKIMALSLCTLLFFCGRSPMNVTALAQEATPTLHLIATIFPAYDIARQIAGDSAQVQLLLPPGSDMHSYEPTPQDIIAIQNADLFLYIGGESDHWVESILASMGADAPRTFRLMDCVNIAEEEMSKSMEHAASEADHGEKELDEHVWTSPKNVILIVQQLKKTLCELSPEQAQVYEEHLQSYQAELEALDAAFADVVKNGKRDLIVFGDRFPMRYFADAYGLRYDAAFPGCSENSEPSVKTVMALVEEVRTQQIPVVFYIEFSSRKTADIIAEETGAKELLFHSCHNVSADEMKAGATYLSLMQSNVLALKEALN